MKSKYGVMLSLGLALAGFMGCQRETTYDGAAGDRDVNMRNDNLRSNDNFRSNDVPKTEVEVDRDVDFNGQRETTIESERELDGDRKVEIETER